MAIHITILGRGECSPGPDPKWSPLAWNLCPRQKGCPWMSNDVLVLKYNMSSFFPEHPNCCHK